MEPEAEFYKDCRPLNTTWPAIEGSIQEGYMAIAHGTYLGNARGPEWKRHGASKSGTSSKRKYAVRAFRSANNVPLQSLNPKPQDT